MEECERELCKHDLITEYKSPLSVFMCLYGRFFEEQAEDYFAVDDD